MKQSNTYSMREGHTSATSAPRATSFAHSQLSLLRLTGETSIQFSEASVADDDEEDEDAAALIAKAEVTTTRAMVMNEQ